MKVDGSPPTIFFARTAPTSRSSAITSHLRVARAARCEYSRMQTKWPVPAKAARRSAAAARRLREQPRPPTGRTAGPRWRGAPRRRGRRRRTALPPAAAGPPWPRPVEAVGGRWGFEPRSQGGGSGHQVQGGQRLSWLLRPQQGLHALQVYLLRALSHTRCADHKGA